MASDLKFVTAYGFKGLQEMKLLQESVGVLMKLMSCSMSTIQRQCIKYIGPKEREVYEVIVEDRKLIYKQGGECVDTVEGFKWIFFLSTSRSLYVGKKEKGQFPRSSFLSGGATTTAGRLVVMMEFLRYAQLLHLCICRNFHNLFVPSDLQFASFLTLYRKFGHIAATTSPHKKISNNSSASLRNIMWISPMLRDVQMMKTAHHHSELPTVK
ncbi:IQ domain-containing protein IQM3-like [Papaver somniferum]|uniref:IQ domain-containing protein IQM3-like n=1 Tax=Papaver somniferum TaxID=3469 RepID=UPI000E6FC23F|nr:IQ domain-containing protein IQM3-like [Papaver somniferum]